MPTNTLRKPSGDQGPLLSVSDLNVHTTGGTHLVRDVSFELFPGETLALVGESGSGKSLTARAVAGLLPAGLVASGSVVWRGEEALGRSAKETRSLNGEQISLLLQDPFTMLNPLTTVGTTVAESLQRPTRSGSGHAEDAVADQFDRVGLPPAASRKYPWELSGGMRQRVGLAAALAPGPKLLIADEPTTALDATTQRDILRLVRSLQADLAMSLLLITHDLRVATSLSDRIAVMSAGRIIEEGDGFSLTTAPREEYTRRLWAAELPIDRRLDDLRVDHRTPAPLVEPQAPSTGSAAGSASPSRARLALEVIDLRKQFSAPRRAESDAPQWALKGVDIRAQRGQSVGVIGESGSGKTTLARCVLGLETPTAGTIDVFSGGEKGVRVTPQNPGSVQCVFQDPYSSLNPAHSIRFTLLEAIRHRSSDKVPKDLAEQELVSVVESVGLPADVLRRRPGTLSGGQRQRVAIARALLMRPDVLVCDEPVAALDLTVQAQVLQVLRDIQQAGTTLLFITHDLSVARQMTDVVYVLRQGEVVEHGSTADVFESPQHAYTQHLLASVPTGDPAWLDPHLVTT